MLNTMLRILSLTCVMLRTRFLALNEKLFFVEVYFELIKLFLGFDKLLNVRRVEEFFTEAVAIPFAPSPQFFVRK